MIELFDARFNLNTAVRQTASEGYFFAHPALSKSALYILNSEIERLPLEVGDHINHPINAGKPNQVQQQHARGYYEFGSPETPGANMVIKGLKRAIGKLSNNFPELASWCPNEIGYQKYRHSDDWISPHRDRASDKLLSITFTLSGSNTVKIFEPLAEPDDYSNIIQIDEFETSQGSIMLLRAPGLGNGEQTIHQVMPPESGSRNIINLRMRPNLLEQPSHPKWQSY
jgi:hypothetical protein